MNMRPINISMSWNHIHFTSVQGESERPSFHSLLPFVCPGSDSRSSYHGTEHPCPKSRTAVIMSRTISRLWPVFLPTIKWYCKQMTQSLNKALSFLKQQRVTDPPPPEIPNLLKLLRAEKLRTGSNISCCPRGILCPSFESAPRWDLCRVIRRRVTCSGCKPCCRWAVIKG